LKSPQFFKWNYDFFTKHDSFRYSTYKNSKVELSKNQYESFTRYFIF